MWDLALVYGLGFVLGCIVIGLIGITAVAVLRRRKNPRP